MSPRFIVAAIIRAWSLKWFYGAIDGIIHIPQLLDTIANAAGPNKETLWKNLIAQCTLVSIAIFTGIIFWHYSTRISMFILKNLEKRLNT